MSSSENGSSVSDVINEIVAAHPWPKPLSVGMIYNVEHVAVEAWRSEVWCTKHEICEPVTRVRSHTSLSQGGPVESFQASVALECGYSLSIVTTARNLRAMGVA